jgi:hypothetical protein
MDFVCYRGLLERLAILPYDKWDDLRIRVILFKGTWYLCEHETKRRASERVHMKKKMKLAIYGGHKFETYITSG